jgi:RimJ/RimL family protein N-acetyltransferase
VELRDVVPEDVESYVRMRCDPVMMADLGGPLPREGMEAKVARDVKDAAADVSWIKMIIPDESTPDVVAGTVTLWQEEGLTEIGWMVLPEFQGRGLAKAAVREVLHSAKDRWGPIHAYPGVENGPSNGICRSLGFELLEEQEKTFAGRVLRSNHWVFQPR